MYRIRGPANDTITWYLIQSKCQAAITICPANSSQMNPVSLGCNKRGYIRTVWNQTDRIRIRSAGLTQSLVKTGRLTCRPHKYLGIELGNLLLVLGHMSSHHWLSLINSNSDDQVPVRFLQTAFAMFKQRLVANHTSWLHLHWFKLEKKNVWIKFLKCFTFGWNTWINIFF